MSVWKIRSSVICVLEGFSRYPLAFEVFSSEPFKNTCHTTKCHVRNQDLHIVDWMWCCLVGKGELGAQSFIFFNFFYACCCDYPFQMSCMAETVKAKESWSLVTSEKSVLDIKHSKSLLQCFQMSLKELVSLSPAGWLFVTVVVGKVVLHASPLYPGTSMFAVVVLAPPPFLTALFVVV